ncbi:hypothetical protein I3843_13G157600 [Carya illinoinensis]|nr:hypothetical protein I3843_13G157600 [Carya illinoinensis]
MLRRIIGKSDVDVALDPSFSAHILAVPLAGCFRIPMDSAESYKKRMQGEDSDLDDDERSLPDEDRALYECEVAKSEGFDIPKIRDGPMFNLIQPRDLNRSDEYKEYAQLAIDEYNRRFSETNAKLELVKVSKAMAHLFDIMRYYITFEAKDFTDGGKTKTYQIVVRDAMRKISVLSFRLKPAEDEQGSGNHGKEWIWEGHLFYGHLVA